MSKNKYITDNMIDKLNYAYHHEISNSIYYDYISSYLDVLGYKNLANYWNEWSQEEKKHSQWVKEFLQNLNIPFSPAQVQTSEYNLNKELLEFVNVTIDREDKTTKLYHDILDIALELENSAMLVQFADKMLLEQIEETNKALTIQDKLTNIGDNKALLQLFDNTFES